jgi:hypothetical protein
VRNLTALSSKRWRAQEDLNPARGSVVHVGVREIPCVSSIQSVRVLPNVTKSSAVAVQVAVHLRGLRGFGKAPRRSSAPAPRFVEPPRQAPALRSWRTGSLGLRPCAVVTYTRYIRTGGT